METCPVCNKPLIATKLVAFTSDGQTRKVGADCWRKIRLAGVNGYVPPSGGPTWQIMQIGSGGLTGNARRRVDQP